MDKMREEFEKHFSQPPFEFDFTCYIQNSAWPGNYRQYHVQCAWEAWQAAIPTGRDQLQKELAEMEQRKDSAYLERNRVVAALCKCFPASRTKTSIEGWSDDWHSCVYLNLPTGQVSWHYHDSHAYLFEFLPELPTVWDGHTTEEKYARLAALIPQPTMPPKEKE